jgi:hypothetical protein
MKKHLLSIALLVVTLAGCSKSDTNQPAEQPLVLTNTEWVGPGEKYAGNGLTYYKQLHFTSATDVDLYDSYEIGKPTDDYTSHVQYKIIGSSVLVTGMGGMGFKVNQTYTYKDGTLLLDGKTYTKYK